MKLVRVDLLLVLSLSLAATPSHATPRPLASSDDPALQRVIELLPEALAANHKLFVGASGALAGFGAGERYPQVWLRDSATLPPLSRWLYGRTELESWLIEHLAQQQTDGSLHDWVAAGPPEAFREWAPRVQPAPHSGPGPLSVDKNTTEADQESSAVLAAYAAWQASGDLLWLQRDVAGRPLLTRLDQALDFVHTRRFDQRRGLVENALTADWGDVSPTYPDQRAIYLDGRTPRVVGLYTNALFVRAARALAQLQVLTGDGVGAARWWTRARAIEGALRGLLWQPERGFFRFQLISTPALARGFPETGDVLALGGHAIALQTGLVEQPQVAGLLALLETRARGAGLASIGAALLPPLPKGSFAHPVMAEPWRYQNGGQWDWFGGRLVAAAFAAGHSEWAERQLLGSARRVAKSGGVFEWYARDGSGQGSPHYAGAASALADAIVSGFYGVALVAGRLDLNVRLGSHDGALDICQPADATCVRVSQRLERQSGRMRVEVETNARWFATFAVRLPENRRPRRVTCNGQALLPRLERHGQDLFVGLDPAARTSCTIDLEPGRD